MAPLEKFLRRNPSGNWVILIFSGQKPCARIIKTISHTFFHIYIYNNAVVFFLQFENENMALK